MTRDDGWDETVGAVVATFAHDESALSAALCQFAGADCTRENILGAAGVLSWAAAFHGGVDGGSDVAAQLSQRIGLLTLIACYSGGVPQRTRQQRFDRIFFKAEICLDRGWRAKDAGHLDVAELFFARVSRLRAQAHALYPEVED